MEKQIVQALIAGEVLGNALFDLGITEDDYVYIKQEMNHIEIGRAKTRSKVEQKEPVDLEKFFKEHFKGEKMPKTEKEYSDRLLDKVAELEIEKRIKMNKCESIEQVCKEWDLEPDEALETLAQNVINAAILRRLLP